MSALKSTCGVVLCVFMATAFHSGCGLVPAPETKSVLQVDTSVIKLDTLEEEPVVPPPPVPADTALNHLAALMAGMDSMTDHRHPSWNPSFIRKFSRRVAAKVRKMEDNRLRSMMEWNRVRMQHNNIKGEQFAFYPFSGGDLIHLAWLYPEADNYLLVAREDVGFIPDLLHADEAFVFKYLRDIDTVLRDIYKRSYFITKNMQEDTKRKTLINGMLPLIVWTIAQLDWEIVTLRYFHVSGEGDMEYVDTYNKKRPPHGAEIKVRAKGTDRLRTIIYVSCDISDRGFKRRPGFYTFLQETVPEPCNSFVKSASYLLHYNSFEKIRQLILDKSAYHIQDDTGIPYRFFEPDAWKRELHGHYYKPISAFSPALFQTDLKKAYADSSLYKGEVGFSLGYHWSTRKQNQLIAIKKS